MTLLKCDLCGCKVEDLAPVIGKYFTEEVKDICSSCNDQIGDTMIKIDKMLFDVKVS